MEAFTRRERRKIISLYQAGWDTEDIAAQFNASQSGVRRVWQQFREEDRDAPAFDRCGRKPKLSDQQKEQLRQIVQEKPDRFMRELAEEVQKRLPSCGTSLAASLVDRTPNLEQLPQVTANPTDRLVTTIFSDSTDPV